MCTHIEKNVISKMKKHFCEFWFLFALSYSDHEDWLTKGMLILISIIPALTLAIMCFYILSPLMRTVVSIKLVGQLITYTVHYGPWFWIHTASSYLIAIDWAVIAVTSHFWVIKYCNLAKHNIGDRLLQITAKRLKNTLRSIDTLSRWGGDEFVVLIDSLPSQREVDILKKDGMRFFRV